MSVIMLFVYTANSMENKINRMYIFFHRSNITTFKYIF